MLKEITDLAGQRERVAETFEEQIIHGVLILAKTLKDERKVGFFLAVWLVPIVFQGMLTRLPLISVLSVN